MELYNEMLMRLLERRKIQVSIPELEIDPKEYIEMKSYQALKQIHDILENESYGDEDCIDKIEEIICTFEAMGSHCGFRHD